MTSREYIGEAEGLHGRPGSYWIASTEAPFLSRLGAREIDVDVAVIGGGIVGITAAYLLKRAGLTVALVEMRRLAADVTGHTTAKLTAQHGARYAGIAERFGRDAARTYARVQLAAVERVRAIAEESGIECDFAREPSFLYATKREAAEELHREFDAQTRAGLTAAYVESLPLPFPVAGAVRVPEQARFHPLRFLLPLARGLPGDGSQVFEATRAHEVRGGTRCEVETEGGGKLRARAAIVASHTPFHDAGLFFSRVYPMRSYALAVRLEGPAPEGLYYETGGPMHSIRTQPDAGGELVILGGSEHKAGQGGDERERYRDLERWVRESFPLASIEYRWSTQDDHTDDGVPFVGAWPGKRNVYVATGFGGWGMTNGVAAATLIAGMILGEPDEEAVALFDPSRVKPLASAARFVKENLNVAAAFVEDRVNVEQMSSAEEVEPGRGVVTEIGDGKYAMHRDIDGTLTVVSPICTHLRCTVRFNEAERTWDCPCHGSRFELDGRVLHGPAMHDLERVEVAEVDGDEDG